MSGHPGKHGSGSPLNAGQASQKAPPPKQQQGKRSKELRADFLLNFQRPSPHQRPSAYAPPPRRRSGPSGRQRTPTAFVKGRFVQSSFRCFVDGVTPDVVEAAFNADSLIDWPNVRRVDLLCDEHPKCPICLEEDLVVPKITRCGHIFCVPCIMRYFLMLSDQNGRHQQRCPVCNDQVTPEDLTSVRFQMTRPLREGDKMSFILAHREGSSMFARGCQPGLGPSMPVPDRRDDVDEEVETLPQLPSEADPGWHFSRVVRLAPGEAEWLLSAEIEALRIYRPAAIAAGDTELLPSIDAAATMLEQQLRSRDGVSGNVMHEGRGSTDAPLPRTWGCCYVEVPVTGTGPVSSSIGAQGDVQQSFACEEDLDDIGPDAEDSSPVHGVTMESPCGSNLPSPSAGPAASPGAGLLTSPALSAASGPGGGHGMALLPECAETAPDACRGNASSANASGANASGGFGGARIVSFYQAGDGRLIFLQPFFTRLLLHEHGGRWNCLPASLSDVRIDRLQDVTITEETRKRHRFLSHLPLGSPVSFAEVDLRTRLSQETKEYFAEEFLKRRQQRLKEKQRAKKEERHSKNRAAEEEEAYYKSLNLVHRSVAVAPPTAEDFAVPLPGRPAEDTHEAADTNGDPNADARERAATEGEEDSAGPTLADKIKEKMAAKVRKEREKDYFPQLGGSESAVGRPSQPGTSAWGSGVGSSKVRKEDKKDGSGAAQEVGPESDEARVVSPMEEQPTFGQALEAALRSATERSSTDRSAVEAEPDDVAPSNSSNAVESGASSKKKKGRAAKATTIRLFG